MEYRHRTRHPANARGGVSYLARVLKKGTSGKLGVPYPVLMLIAFFMNIFTATPGHSQSGSVINSWRIALPVT
jgi:hypothetical protein